MRGPDRRIGYRSPISNPPVMHAVRAVIGNPAGQCYVASEAIYHVLGGKARGFTPQVVRHEGGTHWYLRHRDGSIIDATADQFSSRVPYDQGKGCGFLTREPSKAAQAVLDALPSEYRVLAKATK